MDKSFIVYEHDQSHSCILRLASTPRNLKHVIRKTNEKWKYLKGEIDYDDVLIMVLFENTLPKCHDLIIENKLKLQQLREEDSQSSEEVFGTESWVETFKIRVEEIQKDWKKENGQDLEGLPDLISYIFPALKKVFNLQYTTSYKNDSKTRPQSIRHSYPTNYFTRYAKAGLSKDEVPDQKILSLFDEWRSAAIDTSKYCKTILFHPEERYPLKWNHLLYNQKFSPKMVTDFITTFLLHYAEPSSESTSKEKVDNLIYFYFSSIKEKINLSREKRDEYNEALNPLILDQIKNIFHSDLHKANELFEFWYSQSPAISGKYKEIRDELRSYFVKSVTSERSIIFSLREYYPVAFSSFVYRFFTDEQSKGRELINQKDWLKFRDKIFEDIKVDPNLIILSLGLLVGDLRLAEVEAPPKYNFSFADRRIKKFFQGREKELFKLLSLPCSTPFREVPEFPNLLRKEAEKKLSQFDPEQ